MKLRRPTPDPPGPGQESVWDYPRPPVVRSTDEHVEVWFGRRCIADTRRALRVLETSQAPGYYVPREDVAPDVLVASAHRTFCEWKGWAHYHDVVVGPHRARAAAWSYPEPAARFEPLADHVAFYPQLMDRCLVDGEVVAANEGSFYGGWVTSRVTGPFKGAPDSIGW